MIIQRGKAKARPAKAPHRQKYKDIGSNMMIEKPEKRVVGRRVRRGWSLQNILLLLPVVCFGLCAANYCFTLPKTCAL